MISDLYGNPVFQDQDILDLLYHGKMSYLDQITVEPSTDVAQLIENSKLQLRVFDSVNQSLSVEEFDRLNQNSWYMPEEYKNLNIIEYVLLKSPQEHLERTAEELEAFEQRNMLDLLRWLKYFVDTMRKNNLLWGVGRGSSVASYVLFLIGVHKIDSIKYNLDWQEFLR